MTIADLRTVATYSPDAPVRAADALAAVQEAEAASNAAVDYFDVERIADRLGFSVAKVRGDFASGRVPDAYLVGSGRGVWRTTPAGFAAYRAKIEKDGQARAAGRRRAGVKVAGGAAEPPLDGWRTGTHAGR